MGDFISSGANYKEKKAARMLVYRVAQRPDVGQAAVDHQPRHRLGTDNV